MAGIKTIQWIVKLFFIYLLIFTAFRIATVFFSNRITFSVAELLPSFWLRLKYDLRWIAFILFPIALFSILPQVSPFWWETEKILDGYLGILTLLVLFFGAFFGGSLMWIPELNADALIFAEDPKEKACRWFGKLPDHLDVLGLCWLYWWLTWMFRRTHVVVEDKNANIHKFSYPGVGMLPHCLYWDGSCMVSLLWNHSNFSGHLVWTMNLKATLQSIHFIYFFFFKQLLQRPRSQQAKRRSIIQEWWISLNLQ